MSVHEASPPPPAEGEPPVEERITPRGDFKDSIFWIVLGTAILIASIRMDRLEAQHINPYTVPGLLPGLLGIAMILLGGILLLRSIGNGGLKPLPPHPHAAHERERERRIWVVTALCVGYCVVLIGHGIPFWLASTVYVTGSIIILNRMSRNPEHRRQTPKAWLKALAIGLGASVTTHLVFQELFLVRLP
jgi:hypothetical protein